MINEKYEFEEYNLLLNCLKNKENACTSGTQKKDFYNIFLQKIEDNKTLFSEIYSRFVVASKNPLKSAEDILFLAQKELLVIKAYTTIEQLTKKLISSHFCDKAQNIFLKSFIGSEVIDSIGKNVNMEYVYSLLQKFNFVTSKQDLKTKLDSAVNDTQYADLYEYNRFKTSLQTLKNIRNTVAHTGKVSANTSSTDIISCYYDSIIFINILDTVLDTIPKSVK